MRISNFWIPKKYYLDLIVFLKLEHTWTCFQKRVEYTRNSGGFNWRNSQNIKNLGQKRISYNDSQNCPYRLNCTHQLWTSANMKGVNLGSNVVVVYVKLKRELAKMIINLHSSSLFSKNTFTITTISTPDNIIKKLQPINNTHSALAVMVKPVDK